jgi:hypothetical protein
MKKRLPIRLGVKELERRLTPSITFNFNDDLPGTATPFSDTQHGVTALLTSPADPGAFSGYGAPATFKYLTGNTIYDPGPAGVAFVPLVVSFSSPVSSVRLTFATDASATLNLQALSGGLGGTSVGSTSAVGHIPPGYDFPEGVISFTSAAQPFDTLEFSTVGLATFFAVDDVTITPAPSNTWTGAGANDLWSNPANWQANATPLPNSALLFPAGAQQLTNVNDLGYAFSQVTIQANYHITGSALTVDGNLFVAKASDGFNDGCSTVVNGVLIVGPGSSCTLNGATDQVLTGVIVQGGTFTINAPTAFTPLPGGTGYIQVTDGGTLNLNASANGNPFGFGVGIGSGMTVSVDGTSSLNVGPNGNVTNNGTITCQPGSTVQNNGLITGNGMVNCDTGSFTGQGTIDESLNVGSGGVEDDSNVITPPDATDTIDQGGTQDTPPGGTDQVDGTEVDAGTQSDGDAITIGAGGKVDVTGTLTEGLGAQLTNFGTLTIKPAGTLNVIGSVVLGNGDTFDPLGTVTGDVTVDGSARPVTPGSVYLVGGTGTNDSVQISAAGSAISVKARLNGVPTRSTYIASAVYFFGFGGNDSIQEASGLTIPVIVAAGDGNNTIQLGDGDNALTLGGGNNTVTLGNGDNTVALGYGDNDLVLGNGNNRVTLGSGNNTLTVGNGNNEVQVGGGNNSATLGDGNNIVTLGDGNNVLVEGSGQDAISAGYGDNLIVAGRGQHSVQVGNGNNILIDGDVTLTQSGDTLEKVLRAWEACGRSASEIASIRARLNVTYNDTYANTLQAGRGLDWFWETYANDVTNRKPSDILN